MGGRIPRGHVRDRQDYLPVGGRAGGGRGARQHVDRGPHDDGGIKPAGTAGRVHGHIQPDGQVRRCARPGVVGRHIARARPQGVRALRIPGGYRHAARDGADRFRPAPVHAEHQAGQARELIGHASSR